MKKIILYSFLSLSFLACKKKDEKVAENQAKEDSIKIEPSKSEADVAELVEFSPEKMSAYIQNKNPDTLYVTNFFATWCGPCKVQSSVLTTVKENVGELARIVKIDVDQFPAIAAEYGVRGVPTLAVFKNGDLLWKESGVHDVNTLTKLLTDFSNS